VGAAGRCRACGGVFATGPNRSDHRHPAVAGLGWWSIPRQTDSGDLGCAGVACCSVARIIALVGRTSRPSSGRTCARPDLGCTRPRDASGGITRPSPRAFVGRSGRASPVVGPAIGGTGRPQRARASASALVGGRARPAILASSARGSRV
jgi:hypothetical protein